MSKANFSMLSNLHTTRDIADFLGTSTQNINYYIKAGYLRATKVNGKYLITYEDYMKFYDTYYAPEQMNKQRGEKTLTEDGVKLLKSIVKDMQDDNITLRTFVSKHKDLYILPHPKLYLRYKRNRMIKADRKKGVKIAILAKNYGLSIGTIKKILKKEVDEFN